VSPFRWRADSSSCGLLLGVQFVELLLHAVDGAEGNFGTIEAGLPEGGTLLFVGFGTLLK